jgi:hypothetical protein
MVSQEGQERGAVKWLRLLGGPILALLSFLVGYYLDPLDFGDTQHLSAVPALLFSIVILLIDQNVRMSEELRRTTSCSDRIYEAVKDYLHVTRIGSPERAIAYVHGRIPSLREVSNTSFNLDDEQERAAEKFYDTRTYEEFYARIASYSARGLIWKDVGDRHAVQRFRSLDRLVRKPGKSPRTGYKYRLITHIEPQMNFIILEYSDGMREVLFNWDFRGMGQDPIVLLSRDQHILEMFATHFTHLWRSGAVDQDIQQTTSISEK